MFNRFFDEMSAHPKVTVIIPNWNTRRWLPGCLDGLRVQRLRDFRVILVDNGSSDDSVAFVRQHYPEVQILSFSENRGFAAAVNAGLRQARSEYVVLLNVDTVPQPDWLSSLVETIEQSPPDVGCLASKMLVLEEPETVENAGDILSWYGSARKRGMGQPATDYTQLEEVFSPCAGAALYRQAFLDDVGGFDERFISYLEDVDVGLRGHLLGHRCLYVPTAEIPHQGHGAGISRARYVHLVTRNRLAMLTKNIPLRLLLKHIWTLSFGQVYFFLVYKKPVHSLTGTISFLVALPSILRQRREVQRQRRVPDSILEAMLSTELGEPSLREIVKNKVGLGLKRPGMG
jgi:GT2 family glycosyltransferase